jgi:hypothetical protein
MVRGRARVKRLALAAATVVLAGCGSATDASWATPQSVRLGWHEPVCGGVRIDVRRLTVRPERWSIEATIANEGKALTIGRPHTEKGTYFGVVRGDRRTVEALHAGLLADRFAPALPRRLETGESWSGTYSGPGRLPAEVPLRLVFGRFTTLGKATGFICVSTHHAEL